MASTETVAGRGKEPRADLACCEQMARVFRALGNPTRIGILRRIVDGEMCVSELRDELDCSQPNISQHLGVLRDRGVVVSERDGARVCYRPAHSGLADLLELAEMVFEVEHPH